MSRPTEYPPVEAMSIKALKKLLDREEIAESERKNAVWAEIQRRSDEAVKKSIIIIKNTLYNHQLHPTQRTITMR